MKNIQKLFKKREDEPLDMQTLSTVTQSELCQVVMRFHNELKDSGQQIEMLEEQVKQLKKDLSNAAEEAQLYKNHCEKLQDYAQKSSMETESYKTLLESKAHEVKYFRDKNAELEKSCESVKNISSIISENETLKHKLKEISEKITLMNSEKELHFKEKAHYENELKVYKDRIEEMIKKCQESENQAKTKVEEYFKVKADNKTLKQNIKAQEGQVKEMEAMVKGKTHRITELEAQCTGLNASLEDLKGKIESVEHSYEMCKENMGKDLKEKTLQLEALQEKLDKETAAKISEISSTLSKSIDDYKIKITSLEIERTNFNCEIEKLTNEINDLQSQLKTSQENLDLSNKKRELAKQEVLKLTQKLDHNQSFHQAPIKATQAIFPQNLLLHRQPQSTSLQEHKALQVLKIQLDALYKALMDLMLSANTTRDPTTRMVQYSISSEDFSRFEKDLNKVVMNTKEAAENPAFIDQNPGWMGKISNWTPSKFFSCMNHEERLSAPNPPEKRRSSYKGFF